MRLEKLHKRLSVLYSTKRMIILAVACLALIALAVLLLQPQRSTENFCKVAKEQKNILVGDVNYEQRLEAYRKLEAVSPDSIRPDISTIRKGYEEIIKEPSKAFGTGFGIMGAEGRRSDFIKNNCTDF